MIGSDFISKIDTDCPAKIIRTRDKKKYDEI